MTHKKILDCASELFSKGCYNCVSLSEIASMAGIKKPSIYAHYSSKEELFLSVIDEELEKVCLYMDKIFDEIRDLKSENALYELLKNFTEHFFNDSISRGIYRCLLYTPAIGLQEQIYARTRAFDEKMINIQLRIMKQGIASGEIKDENMDYLIYSFSSLIKGNFAMILRDDDYSLDKLNYCWEIYWNGIKK